MPTLSELLTERIDRLNTVPNALFTGIEKGQLEAYKEILRLMNTLDVVDGVIQLTTRNYAITQEIGQLTQTILFEGEYIKAVEAYTSQFNPQAALNVAYFEKAFGTFSNSDLYTQTLRLSQTNAVNLLNTDAVNQALINPLKDSLNASISSNTSLSEAIANIQRIVIGNNERESNLLGDRKTLVKDAFAISDREYNNVISEQYNFSFYKYQGGTTSDSRCFCVERNNKIYPRKQIEAWGDKKDLGDCRSGKGWQGMNYNTNSKSIFTYVGGYNCDHVLLALPDEGVSDSIKNKAKRKGYI